MFYLFTHRKSVGLEFDADVMNNGLIEKVQQQERFFDFFLLLILILHRDSEWMQLIFNQLFTAGKTFISIEEHHISPFCK